MKKAPCRAALMLSVLLLLAVLATRGGDTGLAPVELNAQHTSCIYRGQTYSYLLPDSDTTAQACAVWRIDSSTQEYVLVAPDVSTAVFFENDIYFTDHAARTFSIWKMPLSGGAPQLVRGDGETVSDWPARHKQVFYDAVALRENRLCYQKRTYERAENPAVSDESGVRALYEDDPCKTEIFYLEADGNDLPAV